MRTIFNFCLWLIHFVKNTIRFGLPKKLPQSKEKIVICGNGPSLMKTNFDYFSSNGYQFACVNYFALSEDLFFRIKPKYYCCIDPALFSATPTDQTRKLFAILERVDWDMVFIMPIGAKSNINNKNIKVVSINQNFMKNCPPKLQFSLYKKNLAIVGYQNVIIGALYYFISMNVSEISLIGVETDFHRELFVGENNHVYRKCTHFYGEEVLDLQEKGEIKQGELYLYFCFYYLTLYQYYVMAQYAQHMKVKVYNLCLNSFIDVFEKRAMQGGKL